MQIGEGMEAINRLNREVKIGTNRRENGELNSPNQGANRHWQPSSQRSVRVHNYFFELGFVSQKFSALIFDGYLIAASLL